MGDIRPHISVVIPVYGCREALYELYERLSNSLKIINSHYEIIMVNDACPQNSWEVIKELGKDDCMLRGMNLSRNFGQLKAVLAGLDAARGDWIVVMDCDLQDRPEDIIKLYNKAMEGFDVVFGRRDERKDSLIKRMSSVGFYKVYDYFTDGMVDQSISNFSISSRMVIDNYLRIREQNRSFTLFVKWVGFNQTSVNIEHAERKHGKSATTFRKRWNIATDIIIAQSNKPLKFSIGLGMLVSLVSFVCAVFIVVQYLYLNIDVSGWTSLIVSLYFLSGLVLMNIGILGIYIGKVFDETKNRPIYIIKELIN
ncbi:MAG: glycosyltransferase family 2 protein [Syntrophomonadaceae bacterium]|nr:glycosyltransferase family 2 protein [Syntrophomonadaceae bacterium]